MKKYNYPHTNFTIYKNTLNCGLEVSYIIKKGFNNKYATIDCKYGSIDHNFIYNGKTYNTPKGIAHFLEHKLFEMPGFQDAFVTLTNMGVESNAYTSYNKTSYLISGVNDITRPLKEMLNFVFTPFFDKQRVEDEKSIIASEINMYKDYYDFQLLVELLKNLYHDSTLSEDIAGEVEDIMQVDNELLQLNYDAFYNPVNMHLIVCGDFDYEKLDNELNEFFKDFKFNEFNTKSLNNIKNSTILNHDFVTYNNVTVDKYILGLKFVVSNEERLKEEIIYEALNLILFSKSSNTYQKLLDDNLVSDHYSSSIAFGDDYRFLIIEGISDKSDEVKKFFYELIAKINDYKITDEEVDNFKKNYLGDLYLSQNSIQSVVNNYTTFAECNMELFLSFDIVKNLTKSEINSYLKNINLNNMVFGIMKKNQK